MSSSSSHRLLHIGNLEIGNLNHPHLSARETCLGLVVLASLVTCSEGLEVLVEGRENETVWYASPQLQYLGPRNVDYDKYPIVGEVVFLEEKIKTVSREKVEGKVVVKEMASGQSLESAVRLLNNSNPAAYITVIAVFSDHPGSGNWIRDGSYPGQTFPIFEISSKTNRSLFHWATNQSTPGVIVKFKNEKNPWDTTYRIAVPVVSFYILIVNSVLAVIALYKLVITMIDDGGPRLSIGQCVFAMGLLGTVLRVIFAASDPFGVWGTTYFAFSTVFMTVSLPPTICSLLLISLYWHELIERSKRFSRRKSSKDAKDFKDPRAVDSHKGTNLEQIDDEATTLPKTPKKSSKPPKKSRFSSNSKNPSHSFFKRWELPFFSFYFFVQAFEIVSATLRGYFISLVAVIFIDGALYVITLLGINIFFIVTRIRLQRVFDKLNRSLNRQGKSEKLKLASDQFVAIVIAAFIWIVFVIMAALNVVWSPVGFPIGWWIYFASLDIIQCAQLFMIKAPFRPWSWIFCGLFHPNPSSLLHDRDPSSHSHQYDTNYTPSHYSSPRR